MYFLAMVSGQGNTIARIYSKQHSLLYVNQLKVLGQQGMIEIIQPHEEKQLCDLYQKSGIIGTVLRLGEKVRNVFKK